MTSFADRIAPTARIFAAGVVAALLLALVLTLVAMVETVAACGAAGEGTPAAPVRPTVPPALEARVSAAIAGLWSLDPADVRMSWGRLPATAALDAETPFRLAGSGQGGSFAVVFQPADTPQCAASVRAGVVDSVWVAARYLPAGSTLVAGDIRADAQLAWGPPRSRLAPMVGARTRRAVNAGDLVSDDNARAPRLLASGVPVEVEWAEGAVLVRMSGVTLHAAGAGERVRVKVEGRRTPVVGVVTDDGRVRLSAEAS